MYNHGVFVYTRALLGSGILPEHNTRRLSSQTVTAIISQPGRQYEVLIKLSENFQWHEAAGVRITLAIDGDRVRDSIFFGREHGLPIFGRFGGTSRGVFGGWRRAKFCFEDVVGDHAGPIVNRLGQIKVAVELGFLHPKPLNASAGIITLEQFQGPDGDSRLVSPLAFHAGFHHRTRLVHTSEPSAPAPDGSIRFIPYESDLFGHPLKLQFMFLYSTYEGLVARRYLPSAEIPLALLKSPLYLEEFGAHGAAGGRRAGNPGMPGHP